ncbi:MAG: ATP-binding protein, partial [Paraglaciecola sp.]
VLSDKGIKVELIPQHTSIPVYADVTRLKQLFSNLLSNVAKYAVDGDLLKITMTLVENGGSKEAQIFFEDNGQGVDEHDLPQLFEHLFRVENSRNRKTGGSGLGLSICKKIVEAHHGKITAFSSEVGGLGIKIILPLE